MLFGRRFYRTSVLLVYLILIVACFNQSDGTEAVVTATPIVSTSLPAQITGEKPEPRYAPAMAYDSARKVIVMVGGSTQKETFQDVWEYGSQGWNLIATDSLTTGFAPLMTYDEYHHKLVLFDWASASIWEYDGNRWSPVQTKTRITHLRWPAMTYNPMLRKIVIVGEWRDGEAIETWFYNGVDLEKIDSSHPYLDWSAQDYDWSGQARGVDRIIFPGLAYDPNNNEIILQPTYSWTFALQDNVWGVKLTWKESTLPNCSFRIFCIEPKLVLDKKRNLIVLFDGEATWEYAGENWVKIETALSPPWRVGHAMAYDEARGVVVLFGGADKNKEYLNDLWEYDGITWTQR